MLTLNGPDRSIWVADFETTTREDDCRVWGWGFCDIENPEHVEIGQDIEQFMARVADSDKIVYFHNLAFDGSFMLDWLFRNGYAHSTNQGPRKGEFTTLISNMGKFYSMSVKWRNGRRVEFRDSLKKLPMSVKNVAKAFSLEQSKGDIDYHLERPVGWEITPDEAEYIKNDVQIIARALWVQIQEGMTRLTVGSDSLQEFKRLMSKRRFDKLFPVLPMSMDAEIRHAYRGGFTYADERFRGKIVGPGRVFDVNSLYPSVMYDRILPYGEPIFYEGLPDVTTKYPLFIVSLTFTAKLKPGHIPCIQVKGSPFFTSTQYQTEIKEPVTLSCTNVDLALWREHYDMDILSYNGAWRFHGTSGLFCEYIDKWMAVKETASGGLRTIAKLHLNSLYGKFATNPNITPKIPVMEDDAVKLVIGEEDERNPVYTAMGVFITAYARDVTIRAAQAHYPAFVYADTDSLHLLQSESEADTLDVHPSRLGAWKHEYDFEKGLFARAKCYTELKSDGKYETHIAGLPDTIAERVTFDDYRDGRTFDGKLLPKRVPGGIVLTDVGFTLNL